MTELESNEHEELAGILSYLICVTAKSFRFYVILVILCGSSSLQHCAQDGLQGAQQTDKFCIFSSFKLILVIITCIIRLLQCTG